MPHLHLPNPLFMPDIANQPQTLPFWLRLIANTILKMNKVKLIWFLMFINYLHCVYININVSIYIYREYSAKDKILKVI